MSTDALIMADFKTIPYKHQAKEFELSAETPSRALLWQMRTGKTKVIIDTGCHLYKSGKIDAVLIIAPNGVHENWTHRELPIHHWDTILYETTTWVTSQCSAKAAITKKAKERRKEWLVSWQQRLKVADKLQWYAFNVDALIRPDAKKLLASLVKTKRILLVFDEAHNYRVPGSARTKAARGLAKHCVYKRILTGTLTSNSPLHTFGPYELLGPGTLGFTRYEDFKAKYAVYQMEKTKNGRQYPKLKEYKNLEELTDSMAHISSVVTRDDCADLPSVHIRNERFELSEEQKRLYKSVHKDIEVIVDDDAITIGEMASRTMKLRQVTSGFIIDEYREVHRIPGPNPRLDKLLEEVRYSSSKVIIWCNFKEDIKIVTDALNAEGYKTVEYHGQVGPADRQKARRAFAPGAENDVKALVGQPQAGGSGLDLSAATKIIWYSHIFNAIDKTQANERATKVGGVNIEMVHLIGAPIDDHILESMAEGLELSDRVSGEGLKKLVDRLAL